MKLPLTSKPRCGATLIEVMLAASILLLVVLSLLEGFIVAARISKAANGEPLVADAYAFDLTWTIFNQHFSNIKPDEAGTRYTIPERLVPALCSPSWPAPTSLVKVKKVMQGSNDIARRITVDVEWGARNNRRHRTLSVIRSMYERAPE